MRLEELLDQLEKVRRAGAGWIALCPSHEDKEASLGLTETDDRILLRCYAGCTTESIVASMGLSMSDLFHERRGNASEPEAIYSYRDEAGEELYQQLRFPGKQFRQRHFDGEEWIWNLNGVRRVLYRLPELRAAIADGKTIYFPEGEKDVHALLAAGKEATCNSGGAGKWREEYTAMLQGANVVVIIDRDDAGRNFAKVLREALTGHVAGLWFVQAKDGKDAYDHLVTHGHAVEEFQPMRERSRVGVVSAKEMAVEGLDHLQLNERDIKFYDPLSFLDHSQMGPLAFRPGRIYAVGGYTGDGKTCFALQVARALCEQGISVGFHSLEMTEEDLRNRLLCHEGIALWNLERPWTIRGNDLEPIYRQGLERISEWHLDIAFDPRTTSKKAHELTHDRDHDFVIVDHIHRFAWGHERRKLEEEMIGLTNIALEFNVPVMVLCQLRKFERGGGLPSYPRPTLQDFKETGVISEDSSISMAVWRKRIDGARYDPTGQTEFVVLKNRHGITGEYRVELDGQRQLFKEASVASPFTIETTPPGGDYGFIPGIV